MLKKIFFISVLCFTYVFGYCCPQSCDNKVKKAFEKLKKEVKEGYDANIAKIKLIEADYDNLIIQEGNSTAYLTNYLNRLKIEYKDTKKSNFEAGKSIDLKVLQ